MQKKNEADQLRKHRHLLSKNDISEVGLVHYSLNYTGVNLLV